MAIVLGLVGLVVNFLKLAKAYFIIAVLATILFVLMIVFNGFNLRSLYQAQTDGGLDRNCGQNLSAIHEDEVKQWCPNKYTKNVCRKEDITARWEATPVKTASLNPSCCKCTKNFYLWPYYMLGLWTMATIFWLFVFLASAFYLSENVENYGAHKMTDSLDAVFIALGILAFLAFGLYFLLRGANTQVRSYPAMKSYNNPAQFPNADYKMVDNKITAKQTRVNDGSIRWNPDTYKVPAFSKGDPTCTTPENCVMRFALLSRNAKIVVGESPAISGDANSRLQFFPGCTNSNNNYVFFYGNEEEIQRTVSSISFIPNDPARPGVDAAYYHDQVAKNKINAYGMQSSEDPSTSLNQGDATTCFNGFQPSATTQTCPRICKLRLPSSTQVTNLKGRLFYLDNEGARDTNVPSTVSVRAFRNGTPVGEPANLFSGGVFVVPNVPVLSGSAYPVTLQIQDSAKIFLPDAVDVAVPAAADTEVSAGQIQLVTMDGKYVKPTNAAGIANRTAKQGDIEVNVSDLMTNAVAKGVQVKLVNGGSLTGSEIASESTDMNGKAVFKDVLYGPYTVIAQDSRYKTNSERIAHASPNTTGGLALLSSSIEQHDMAIEASTVDPTADFDLKLAIQNQAGKQCTVEPANKYCAYTKHASDDTIGGNNSELVLVKRLSVAEYKAYMAPSPSFNLLCPEIVSTQNTHFAEAATAAKLSWDWNTFKKTTPLQAITFLIRHSSSTDTSSGTGLLGALRGLTASNPVQTRS